MLAKSSNNNNIKIPQSDYHLQLGHEQVLRHVIHANTFAVIGALCPSQTFDWAKMSLDRLKYDSTNSEFFFFWAFTNELCKVKAPT